MSQLFELSTRQVSVANIYFSLIAALSFIGISTLASELPTVPYQAATSLEERRVHIEKVCAKYNDKLKYEYRALHDVPSTQIFQNHLGQSKDDFDHPTSISIVRMELGIKVS